ncbi:hypothetical protein [Pseudofrankia asymbiotica]|uniref:Uncharacterized protein n=1 Tax=Pseudofrankia asymbiotica TaxID=1834516 RepID=A0A1V2IAJ7_9ACTN|nr:hypothetical protein [Pseudofrankia asymbiotica]ONH29847.1 hypothetical protein BL253_15740 [Pseudofrankia asymbiotica]
MPDIAKRRAAIEAELEADLEPGDPVMIMASNRIEHVVADLATRTSPGSWRDSGHASTTCTA